MQMLLRHITKYQSLFQFRVIETKLLCTVAFKKKLEMIYSAKKILLIVSWYHCPEILFGSDCNKIPASPPWSPCYSSLVSNKSKCIIQQWFPNIK